MADIDWKHIATQLWAAGEGIHWDLSNEEYDAAEEAFNQYALALQGRV